MVNALLVDPQQFISIDTIVGMCFILIDIDGRRSQLIISLSIVGVETQRSYICTEKTTDVTAGWTWNLSA